jgi:uroporphyrinogen decarboxylase
MVTSLERVMATMMFQEPDRVPAVPLVLGVSRRILGVSFQEWSLNPEIAAQAFLQTQELFGFDALFAAQDLSVEAADFGAKVVYPLEDVAHPDYDQPLIKTVADYTQLKPFDPRTTPRMKGVLRIIEILLNTKGQEVPVLGFSNGPLCVLSMLRGSERLFLDCLKHPQEVHAALEIITQVLIEYIRAQCQLGVAGVCIDVLYGARSTLSKEMWIEFEVPYARRMCDEIRKNGRAVALHNCGSGPYFDAMIEYLNPLAISYHYLPSDCQNSRELKEKYGKKVVLIGHINCPNTLFFGKPVDVERECKELIEALAPGGGFILASGCEFPPNASLLNIKAIVQAASQYGQYRS